MNAAQLQPLPLNDPAESLTAAQWSTILGVSHQAFRDRRIPHSDMALIKGALVKVWSYASLPADYQATITEARARHRAMSAAELLDMRDVSTRWAPDFEFTTKTEGAQAKAFKVKEVMRVYYSLLDAGREKQDANREARFEWHRQFGKRPEEKLCSEKVIRNWEKWIDHCGGFEFAPIEAYCDHKDVPHPRARRENKLNIPAELIEAFKALTAGSEHITGAYHGLVQDWQNGRPVPGLGINPAFLAGGDQRRQSTPFPFTFNQLRPFAASTPARRRGSHGKARAARDTLPYNSTTTANLRRAQLYMLDDTRIDIIATDDLTGRPVELKSYWMIDVGCRRIEGFVCREAGNIRANDVDALVARVLRSSGIAAQGSGYTTMIKFERGTTACSPAREKFLLGAFPGRLVIDRTAIDGGRNFEGDYSQSGSGHWMGKAHIESFNRTLAYFIEHVAGQRGGTFRRQPASLRLQGRDRKTGLLKYDAGGRIHEAALLNYADRAMECLENGGIGDPAMRRLKISALKPVSWIIEALKEFVTYYNSRTDHRMEGFDRIEHIGEKGQLEWRMESPNERAAQLDRFCPTERISAANAAFLARTAAKAVTVTPNGVIFDMSPFTGLRFWKPDSIACHEASLLAKCEKRYVALFDPETLLHWTPDCGYRQEIYLMSDAPANWKPGDPVPSRFLEALPLFEVADRANPADMAAKSAQIKETQERYARELVRISAPLVAKRMAEAESNIIQMQGVVSTLAGAAREIESTLIREIETNPDAVGCEPRTRREQLTGAAADLARFQAQHAHEAAPERPEEPEVI